jgi:hypothetical protein
MTTQTENMGPPALDQLWFFHVAIQRTRQGAAGGPAGECQLYR